MRSRLCDLDRFETPTPGDKVTVIKLGQPAQVGASVVIQQSEKAETLKSGDESHAQTGQDRFEAPTLDPKVTDI